MPRARSVSILVVSWNGRSHLAECLPALLEQHPEATDIEILVFDNGSSDSTAEFVRASFPGVRLVESAANVGFAAGNNRLAELASGDALVLVNNDTRAEPHWLEALVETYRSAAPDVAAVAGRIVDWGGLRLDFGEGIATFDGHALPLDHGRPCASARLPAEGEELLFGCGGNLLVRRESFLAAGGFDESYFAYFEDVDLGWRLWAGGERVIASRDAQIRHRLSATSARLGNSLRGSLFERNALWTAVKNFEDGLRERMLPVVLLTYLARLEAMLAEEQIGGATLRLDPMAGMERSGTPLRESITAKYRRLGTREFVRRGSARALRGAADLVVAPTPPRPDRIEVTSDRSLAQIRALSGFLGGLDQAEREHVRLRSRRRRPDREIFERFPLWIVPTYPGDRRLFASEAFRTWLPEELRFERAELNELLTLS